VLSAIVSGAVITVGVAEGSLVGLFLGELIVGIAFGASFIGALRQIVPLAAPHQRAGVVSGIYVVACLAFDIPMIIAGQLAAPLGLVATIVGYSAVVALVGAVALVARVGARRMSAD
jgi:hypothetical protein